MRFELNHLSGPDMWKTTTTVLNEVVMWWLCEKWDAQVKWFTFPASEGELVVLASKENQLPSCCFFNELSQAKLGQAQIMHPSLLGSSSSQAWETQLNLTQAHEPGLGLRSNQALNKPSSIQLKPSHTGTCSSSWASGWAQAQLIDIPNPPFTRWLNKDK